MVGMVCLLGCSQKDENIEATKKKSVVTQSAVMAHMVTLKQTPIVQETISKSYIESIENELQKREEPILITSHFIEQEEEQLAPLPAHIQNSSIESVPR